MDFLERNAPYFIVAGICFITATHWMEARDLKKRNYQGTINNCQVVRDAKLQGGPCLDCPDYAIETLEVKCATDNYFFTDIDANGVVDNVRAYEGGFEITEERQLGKSSNYQAIFDKWQKLIDENK